MACRRINGLFSLLLTAGSICLSYGQAFRAFEKPPAIGLDTFVDQYFLNGGIEIQSITFSGNGGSIGYFTDGAAATGIEEGLVLSTGFIEPDGISAGVDDVGNDFASSDNGSSHSSALLAPLTSGDLANITSLQITFVPNRSVVRFNYIFASEEYPEFGCDTYNDVFGFFIEGAGFDQPTNIALVPGTDLPVAINNIHPPNPLINGCESFNEDLFNDNNDSDDQPVFDGFTTVFTAEATVIPCEAYTITLEIADVRDKIYDSAVFLQANSFDAGYTVELRGPQQLSTECPGEEHRFRLKPAQMQAIVLPVEIWAGDGPFSFDDPLETEVTFMPGQTEAVLDLNTLLQNYGFTERDSLSIIYEPNACRSDTFIVQVSPSSPTLDLLEDTIQVCSSDPVFLEIDESLLEPESQIRWLPASLFDCDTCPQPKIRPTEDVLITVQIEDGSNCPPRDYLFLEVEECLPPDEVNEENGFYAPTAFSPNDDGVNDLFRIYGPDQTVINSFQVYDRWGNLLFESYDFNLEDTSAAWDGNSRGIKCNPGVYIWKMRVQTSDQLLFGEILLTR